MGHTATAQRVTMYARTMRPAAPVYTCVTADLIIDKSSSSSKNPVKKRRRQPMVNQSPSGMRNELWQDCHLDLLAKDADEMDGLFDRFVSCERVSDYDCTCTVYKYTPFHLRSGSLDGRMVYRTKGP